MLESISWPEFISTITLTIGGYYVITLLLLYSSEITNFFKQKKLTPSGTETKSVQNDSNESDNLMGSVRYQNLAAQNLPREETANAEDLHVALSQEDEEAISAIDVAEEHLKNDLASIQPEISSLIEVISQRSKEESISLFKTLLSNYPQFIRTTYQQQLSQMIYDFCKKAGPHHFELSEINSWWTEPGVTSNHNQ
jgi:FtsZ-interacting cell division protein ZipA